MRLILTVVALGAFQGCGRHLTSTDRFILGEIAHERLSLIAQAREEATAKCGGGDIELVPGMAELGGGEQASDYRCLPRQADPQPRLQPQKSSHT